MKQTSPPPPPPNSKKKGGIPTDPVPLFFFTRYRPPCTSRNQSWMSEQLASPPLPPTVQMVYIWGSDKGLVINYGDGWWGRGTNGRGGGASEVSPLRKGGPAVFPFFISPPISPAGRKCEVSCRNSVFFPIRIIIFFKHIYSSRPIWFSILK